MSAQKLGMIQLLSSRFNASERVVRSYLYVAPRRYKQYSIPKRNGKGDRIIAQPTKALKMMQRLIMENYLKKMPIHECANAYVKGKSIKTNIAPHLDNAYLLKMDFSDFFPSLKPADLIQHFELYDSPPDDDAKFVLENMFFFSPTKYATKVLSIGAPSSPFISNTLLFEFDSIVFEMCKKEGITYTRYADDLSFSTNKKNILYSYPEKIGKICRRIQYPKLTINENKTVFTSKAKNRHVTGLVINNSSRISLGREKKRYIKSLVWKFTKKEISTEELDYLRGMIAFSKGVEPSFFEALVSKYGDDTLTLLLKLS